MGFFNSGSIERILISEDEIKSAVKEMGKKLTEDYKDKENVTVIGILKGSCVFMVDLIREIDLPITIDFMSVSSYGSGVKTSGVVKIIKDLDSNIEGKDIIIVEDILDSGKTLSYLVGLLSERNPKSIKIVTLLDKPERREVDIKPDYTCFTVPNAFVIGYGLDYDEKYRNLPYVGILSPKEYMDK